MRFLIIADTHFGHDAIVKHTGRRADYEGVVFSQIVQTMCLKAEPTVLIHLGDVAWRDYERYHRRLIDFAKGYSPYLRKCWLTIGNHEKHSISWYLKQGWDFAASQIVIDYMGMRIAFSHAPIPDDGHFDLNIHGHLHNTGHRSAVQTEDKHLLVEIDSFLAADKPSLSSFPMTLDTLIRKWEKRKTRS